MEAIITKQKDVLNGNEAYLLGVDKIGQQIWIEVLNNTEIKCEVLQKDNHNLNFTLDKKVFNETDGNYLSSLFNHYSTRSFFFKKDPEDPERKENIKVLVRDIVDVLKPTN